MINNWIYDKEKYDATKSHFICTCPSCNHNTVIGQCETAVKSHKFCGWCGKQNIIFEDEIPKVWTYDTAPTSYKPCPICGHHRGKWIYKGGYHARTIRRECDKCGFTMTVVRKIDDGRICNVGDPQLRTCWNYIHTLEDKDKGKFTIPWTIRRSNGKTETYNLEVYYEKK